MVKGLITKFDVNIAKVLTKFGVCPGWWQENSGWISHRQFLDVQIRCDKESVISMTN